MNHCKNCTHSVFDKIWGEWKCKLKHRQCFSGGRDKDCDKYEKSKEKKES